MKQYLINPFGQLDCMQNHFFEKGFRPLKDKLLVLGIDINTYDLGDLAKADKIIFWDFNPDLLRQCLDLGVDKSKLVLILYEPEVNNPGQYSQDILNHFGIILAIRDDLVDNKKIYKIRYLQGGHYIASSPSFNDRNFLTLINANKYSYVDGELYSYRRKAIKYFDKKKDFVFYGYGWNNRKILRSIWCLREAIRRRKIKEYLIDYWNGLFNYKAYKGSIQDKYEVLSKYKYCLCFENDRIAPGYITEKIFDCFFSGTVPVYLGPDNIEEYIPKECFIDMRKFSSFGALEDYLRSLSQSDFSVIQKAGYDYINSESFKKWTPEYIFDELIKRII